MKAKITEDGLPKIYGTVTRGSAKAILEISGETVELTEGNNNYIDQKVELNEVWQAYVGQKWRIVDVNDVQDYKDNQHRTRLAYEVIEQKEEKPMLRNPTMERLRAKITPEQKAEFERTWNEAYPDESTTTSSKAIEESVEADIVALFNAIEQGQKEHLYLLNKVNLDANMETHDGYFDYQTVSKSCEAVNKLRDILSSLNK